jgi:peptidoglycan/xylan/chitin deacetylase (PgdA/CDA1 family)
VIESLRKAPAELDLQSIGLGRFTFPDHVARRDAAARIIGALKYLPHDERYAKAREISRLSGVTPPDDLMMTDSQVGRLHAAGIEIGAHTVSHPILARVDRETARTEMLLSRRKLAELTNAEVTSFAYPNGAPNRDYHVDHASLARECGFELALTTAWGTATAAADVYQLPRIAPWDRSPLRYAGRIARAYRQRDFEVVRSPSSTPGR